MKWSLILFVICICVSNAITQDTIPTIIIEKLEDALENQNEEAEVDISNIAEDLSFFRRNPVDLNLVTEDQLQEMQILNSIQINNFLSYRAQLGPFYSIYELQAIPTFDLPTIREFRPFVKVSGNAERRTFDLSSILEEGTSQVFFKWKRILEDRKGFESIDGESPAYLGDPNHYFLRYKFDYGQIFKFGLTGEKDPGEEFFTGSNKQGFDFYSGYVAARDINGWIKDVTIGDYTISMAQGLILHNSFGGSKSSDVMNIKKGGRTIKPYSSVNEVNQFRGAATTLSLHNNMEATIFYSDNPLSGTVNIDTTIDAGFTSFSAIVLNGFHRTEAEIAKKNTVSLQSAGFVMKYRRKTLGLSLNGVRSSFSIPLNPTLDLYRQYRFSGDELTNASIGYSYRWRNFNFFGEIAGSDNQGKAQFHGVLLTLDRNIDFSVAYRNYDRDYQVLNANAFGEASTPTNEKGVYAALVFRPTRGLIIQGYVDMWTNPWLGFRRDAPSEGVEYFTRIEYNKRRKFNTYIQYKYEKKQRNTNNETIPIDQLGTSTLHRLRLHLSQTVTPSVRLRSRAEFSFFSLDGEHSKGSLVYQDIIYRPQESGFSMTARYALFDTDNFDTRIYMYENDILYEFSIPFYQGRGSRYYVKAKYRLGRHLRFEMRYSQTHLIDAESSGSGGQMIIGPNRSEIKALVRYVF